VSILSLEAVSKNFGIKPLLEDVTFSQEIDEKIGVIGPNGSGKSTLLRLIAGVEPSDSGRLTVQKTIHLAYLPQNPVFEPGHTVLDAVFVQDNDATRRLHDYEAACRALEKTGGRDEALQRRVADLSHQLDVTGGWDLEVNARAILDKLGITDTDATVETLSGGQRKRVALARALILQPDLLILDEPTNHLDADTIAWLEDRLARYTRALLLVTHDRYFLDRITNTMLEIEHHRTHRFEGNYPRYLEMKAERDVQREAEAQKKAGLIRHELAWLRRGAKARTSKQKARIDRAHALMEQPDEKSAAPLKLASPTQRLGKKVIEVRNVSKSYDGLPLLSDFSFSFTRGGRIGIIGPNGTGKTTFLDILAGRTNPDAGAVEIGQTVAIGYYDQESAALKEDLRVIDYV
jgi:ATP-binding cassette subfamily F protein uup